MELNELALQAKAGNKKAFEEIIKKLNGYIYNISREVYINGYDTEDLMQIGYMSLLKAVNKYNPDKSNNFLSYAISAIKKNFYYEIRQKSKYNTESSLNKVIEEGIEIIENIASHENIEENFLLNENIKALTEALDKLLPEERNLINYVYFNNGKLTEFAKNKNIKYITCAKLKEKILKKLKKNLQQKFKD